MRYFCHNARMLQRLSLLDPRYFQITALSLFLFVGVRALEWTMLPWVAVTALSSALLTQWIASKLVGLPTFEPKSALITGLSLCLLLRTDVIAIAAFAGVVAIASKFILRFDGRHIFNPANFALVLSMLLFERAWISPGQWGSVGLLALLFISIGVVVLTRAQRLDVSLAFLGTYALIVLIRALWLADPLTIAWHHLQSGALLVFAFYMITDPKTTPQSRLGRIVFGMVVASVGAIIQFGYYQSGGVIWALVLCAPLTWVLDRFVPRHWQEVFHWGPSPMKSVVK